MPSGAPRMLALCIRPDDGGEKGPISFIGVPSEFRFLPFFGTRAGIFPVTYRYVNEVYRHNKRFAPNHTETASENKGLGMIGAFANTLRI